METNIIQVGNSGGIIIPAKILKQLKLSVKSLVKITREGDSIIITPAPRQGWSEKAKSMHKAGDDALLIPDVFDDETLEEWK